MSSPTPEAENTEAINGANDASRWRLALRAFDHRNFRLFFMGQTISLIGTWMQQLAMIWLVYRLTGSAVWLGIIGFSSQIPTFLLSPVAGVLTDRWNRHRMILCTQTLAMLQAFLLAFLVGSNLIAVWQLVVLSLVLGVVNTFDITGRQAFLTEMVARRKDLANAIALNSSMVNATRLVGPALAGFLIEQIGEKWCFFLNGTSYLAVLASLWAMTITPRQQLTPHTRFLRGLHEGFTYAFGFAPIRSLLLLMALVSLMGVPYMTLLPVFATDVLHSDAGTLGLLIAAAGSGALVGALYLAARNSILGLGVRIALSPILFGVALIGFTFSHQLGLSSCLLFLIGLAMMVQMAATNTILQLIVDEDKRGRVMSFYTMAFMGMTPLGSLVAGGLADRIGAPLTLQIGGVGCIVGSLLYLPFLPSLRRMVRPIYIRMGIIPEVATGIETATEMFVPPEES